VTAKNFTDLADLVRRRSGLALTPAKFALAKNRLKPVARRFGFRDTAALFAELPFPSEELARAVTEALTTNETSFFRDPEIFRFLEHAALPALIRVRSASKRIRIWCAAISTGQEAYSVAATLDDAGLARQGWKIDLVATDLNECSIERAKAGFYAPYEVERGLTPDILARHFTPDDGHWRASDRLRRMIHFRPFNLLDHFGWLGDIDIILCRNVLLYLEPGERAQIHTKLADALVPDGYLFLGDNEDAGEQFVPAVRGVYVRARAPRLAMFG
jgi:chemotaxis protein methyltransferase CheR